MKRIIIVGAGLSGMVAAINLARGGYEVTILEKEKQIGGPGMLHPSFHATPIDVPYTSDFIGIDLSGQFQLLNDWHTWVMDKRIETFPNNYGVERGPRSTSIDLFLKKQAEALGVVFEFGYEIKRLADIPPGSIIATGLMRSIDDFRSYRYTAVYGYSFMIDHSRGPACWQYADMYSSDYFYAVALNGALYGLLFGRNTKIEEKWLEVVEQQFEEREGIKLHGWRPMQAETIMMNRLFAGPNNSYILTGTAAGCIDPFFGFGIVGALTSGKIAALAVDDPIGATRMFAQINRNFNYLEKLFNLLALPPRKLRWKIYQSFPQYYNWLKPIFGRVGKGIPGYPHDWLAEFTYNAK